MTRAYPWRGLGLSSNLNASEEPNPYRLLDASPGAFDFVEYSAPLSLETAKAQASLFEEMWRRREEVPVLFHPVHLNLYGPELEPPESLRELAEHARAVGSAWVGNDIGWWHSRGTPFPGYLYVTPSFDADGVHDAAVHARHVQSALGETPLLIENPAVIARRGSMHVLDFMRAVHEETGCDLLIDLGHLWSHQLTCGLPMIDEAFERFPWDRVIEVHLAGGVVTRRGERSFYVDDHTQPVREELFELLGAVLPRCTNLRALTYEGDGHPREIAVRTLSRLRGLMPPRAQQPASDAKRGASALSTELRTRPWELFEEAHAARAPAGDPAGVNAEIDFRAAVIAERLDAEWPMTRLLLAGTPEKLRGFMASAEYRKQFDGGGKGLSGAFATWARRACMTSTTAQFASAVALETWAQTLHRHQDPAPQFIGLAPGVFVGTFPADLSELAFAVKALRRHLAGRAWASETLELSALDALGQIAGRAQPGGGWNVVVRRTSMRTEFLSVSSGLHGLLRAAERGLRPEAMAIAPESVRLEALRLGLLRLPASSG